MSTEEIERNENRTQTKSGKINVVFCPGSVMRTLSLAQEFTQMFSEYDCVEPLQRNGDSLEQK